MGKIKSQNTNRFIDNFLTTYRDNQVEQLNRDNVLIDDALNATPEYRQGPLPTFDVNNLSDLQLQELNLYPEETYQKARDAFFDKIDDDLLQEKRDKLYAEIDKAFEKEDTDFFQQNLSRVTEDALIQSSLDAVLKPTLYDNIANKLTVGISMLPVPGIQMLGSLVDNEVGEKITNQVGYNITAGLDDAGAFFSAPGNFRFPTSRNFNFLGGGQLLPGSVGYGADKAMEAYNTYMDNVKTKGLTEPEKLSYFESLVSLIQDNKIQKGFIDAAEENRAIASKYKLSNKTISNDGWSAIKDPNYWVDFVAQGIGSAVGFIGTGAAIGKIGKAAKLGNTANRVFTALTLTNVEGSQIATDVANTVFTKTLDKHTDGGFSEGQNDYVNREMQKHMAFAKEQGKDLTPQELVKFELDTKDNYLKLFSKNNEDIVKKAHQAAVQGFSQAASVNNVNLLPNLTGANLLVNGFKQQLVNKPLKELGKTFLKEGIQEFSEEGVGNYIAEKSGIARGMNAKYGSSELLDDLISLEALEQGIAGFITGGLMGGGGVAMNLNQLQDNYQKQQAILEKYNNLSNKNILDQDLLLATASTLTRNEQVKNLLEQHAIARVSNDKLSQIGIESIILAEQVTDAVKNSTLPQLKAMYNKIASNSVNSAEARAKAVETLTEIEALENIARKHYDLKNTNEVVHKYALLRSNDKQKLLVTNDRDVAFNNLVEHASTFKSKRKGVEINEESITIDIDNILENPYTKGNVQYKLYEQFLKSKETANLLAELDQQNYYLDSINKSSENTKKQLTTLASKEHQRKLEAKEKLALKLKSLKESILGETIKKVSKGNNQLFDTLVDNLSFNTKNEYNNAVDKVVKGFKDSKLIPYYELEDLKNIFKISNELTPNQIQAVETQAINTLAEEITKEKETAVKENIQETSNNDEEIPQSIGIDENVDTPESIGIGVTDNTTSESIGVSNEQIDIPESENVLDDGEVVNEIRNLLNNNSDAKKKFEDKIDILKSQVEQLTEQRIILQTQTEIIQKEYNDALTDESKVILKNILDTNNIKLDKIDNLIKDITIYISQLTDVLNPTIDTNIEFQESLLADEIAQQEIDNIITPSLTAEQEADINSKMEILGGKPLELSNPTTNNSAATQSSPVVTTTFEQNSIIRTSKAPLLGNSLVRKNEAIRSRIETAFKNFLFEIDNPNVTALNRVLSYSIDEQMLRLFGLQNAGNAGKYPGVQGVMSYLNNGVKYTEQQLTDPTNSVLYLSDALVLALEIKVMLDDESYTYLVDDGYFWEGNIRRDQEGNVIFEDGRKLKDSDFLAYKQQVINEKREIIAKIISGQNPKSVIIKQDHGSLPRKKDSFVTIDKIEDFNPKINQFFIVKDDGKLDGGPIVDFTDILTNSNNPGTLAIGTMSPTGNIILEGLKANNLSLLESRLLLEAAKIIIDNVNLAEVPTTIEIDGNILAKNISPLAIFDLMSNLITINKTGKSKQNRLSNPDFISALSDVSNLLNQSEEKALNYFLTKFRKSSKQGINRTIKDALDTINKESGTSRVETLYDNNAEILGIGIEDDASYNQFVGTGFSTEAQKLTRTNSGIVAKLIQEDKKETTVIEERIEPSELEAKKAEVKRLEKELFEKSIPLKNWTSVEHNKYVTLLGLRGDVEKRDLLRNLEPSASWQLYAVETLSEEEAKEVLNNVSTDAKADIPIGKVGNTHYEVKADGVYFEGKKLDNPENKTHRQLIEADIEKRRQEELDRETPVKNENITVDFGGGVVVKYQVITYKNGSVKISRPSEKSKRYNELSNETFKDYAKIDFESDAKGIIKTELVKDDYTDEQSQEIKTSKEKTINAKYDAELKALGQQPTSTTQTESNSALKDVESTAKALEGKNTALIQAPLLDKIAGNAVIGKSAKETIAEEYHKAKADGSNPELVKAVESLLSKEQTSEVKSETPTDDTYNIVSASVKTNISEGRKKVIVEIDEKGNQSVKEIEFTKEDAEVELDRLEALAQRGKLTPSEFIGSYFGQSTDTGTLSKVKENIKNDAVGFIEKLRKSFEAKSESLLSKKQNLTAAEIFRRNANGINTDDVAFSTINSITDLKEDESLVEQVEWLQKNLPQIPSQEYKYILPLMNDKIALGYFVTGLETLIGEDSAFGIRYSKYQPTEDRLKGIVYHEAFHAVIRSLMSEKEYNEIIAIDSEENLSEAFRMYMRFGVRYKNQKVTNLFDRIIQYLLNFLNLSNEAKINKLFSDISTGKYKYAPLRTERITKFGQTYSSIDSGITTLVAKEFAKSVVMMSLDNTNLEVLEKITDKEVKQAIALTLNYHTQNPRTEAAATFEKFLTNYNILEQNKKDYEKELAEYNKTAKVPKKLPDDILVEEANKYLQSIIKENLKEQAEDNIAEIDLENNEITNENESNTDISSHTVDSNLINYNLKAPKFIKVLLASIPKIDNNGNYTFNKHTGFREPVNYRSLYTSLLDYMQGSFNDIIVNDATIVTEQNLAKYKVLKKLDELSVFKPELRQLYTYLTTIKQDYNDTEETIKAKKALVEQKKGLFYAAMALNKESYLVVTYNPKIEDVQNEKLDRGYDVSVWESGAGGPSSELMNKWKGKADWASKLLITSEDGQVAFNQKVVKEISNATESLSEYLSKINIEFGKEKTIFISQQQKNDYYNSAANNIIEYFKNHLGVSISKNALDLMVYEKSKTLGSPTITYDSNKNIQYSKAAFNQLVGIFEHASSTFKVDTKYSLAFKSTINFKTSLKEVEKEFKKAFENIAKVQYLFEDHLGAATIMGADNKPVFMFDFQSDLQNRVNFLQSNTPESSAYIAKLTSKVEHSNSFYLNYLKNKKIGLVRLLQKTDKRDFEDRGVSGTTIPAKDDLIMNINLTLNSFVNPAYTSYVRLPSFADKGTSDLFYSMPQEMVQLPVKSYNDDGTVKEINVGTLSIFYNYFLSELERITYTGEIPFKNLKKNKLNSYLFPDFSPTAENAKINELARFLKVVVDKKEPNQNLRTILDNFVDTNGKNAKYYIEQELVKFLNKEIQKYKDNLIEKEDISKAVVSAFISKGIQSNIFESIVATTAINSVIAFNETNKMFIGSIAGFKSYQDYAKRTPAIISKGYMYALQNVNDLKFNLGVVKTTKKTSSLYTKEMVESFRPLLENKVKAFIKEKNLNRTVESFKDVIDKELINLYESYNQKINDKNNTLENQLDNTDAQGYITLDRWYKITKGLHKSSNKVDKLYQKLKDGTATYEDHLEAKTFLQPIKGVISELHLGIGDFAAPIYIKYSQFILTPQLVKSSKALTNLYNKMMNEKLDEVVFDTTSKGDFIELTDFDKPLSQIALNTSSWKLQVDFTAKNYKGSKTLVGTQFIKNIMSNIRQEELYEADLTGKQLIANLNRLLSTLTYRKAETFYKNNKIIDFAKRLDLLTDIQKEALGIVSITSMPQILSGLEASVNSSIKKNITEVQMNGGPFIQTSNEFFTDDIDLSNTDVRWLLNDSEKKELTGSTPNKDAYILIPYNLVEGLTDEQLKTTKFSLKALQGLGYRIPNQPKASIDKIRIAGILPRGYGDTVVVYNEGTKKFGYDFDVDKKYIVLPDIKYNRETNTVEYIQPPNDNDYLRWTESQINNKIIEYWRLLVTKHFDEIVTPLDSDVTKSDIIEAGAILEPPQGLEFGSNETQLGIKRNNTLAKKLIGPFANLTSDIQANQYAGVYLPYILGIGNKTEDGFIDLSQAFDTAGNLITDNATGYQNAAVDAAKDDYIIQGNFNNYTASLAVLLLKAGVENKFIANFMASPVIKQYVILMSNGSTHSKAIKELSSSEYEYFKNKELSTLAVDVANKLKTKSEREKINPNQILALFDKLKSLADIDTKQTLATKGDVDGFGKTMVDKFVLQENIRSIMKLTPQQMSDFNSMFYDTKLTYKDVETFNQNSDVKNFIYKFIDKATNANNKVNRLTPLGMHYKTAVLEMRDNYQDDFPILHYKFREFAIIVSNQIGENFLTNKQTVKNLYDAFYNYVTKKSVLRNPSSDLRTKLLSETGLAKEVKAIMDKNPDFEANAFINQLIFSTDPVQKYTFINVDNRRIKDDKNEIIEGWDELLNSPDPKIKEIGYKLVEYAAQAGTTYNLTSFFQYIPPTVFKTRPINIDTALEDSNSIMELVEQTFRHNYKNKNLVRELATKIEFDKDNKQLIHIDNAYAVTKNGVSAPFVTTNPRNGITGLRSKKLYQLHNVFTDSFGKTIHTYKLTNTLGYSSKYGTVNEYGTTAPITLNKDSVVRNIEKINPVFLNNIAEFRLPIQPIKENPFKGKLIFAMSGTGKTTAMETNEDIVDAETYYKKLLNNDNIQEAERAIITDPTTGALNWDKIMPIRKLVANFVNEQLSQGKIVVSGLNFLAMQSERLGVKFDYAVILKDAELFKERVTNRKDNPIILDNEIKKDNVILERKNLFNVTPIQSADKKAVIKASVATQFIGFGEGIVGSSTALYAKQIREQNSKFKIPISKTLNEFLEPFFNSNDESIVEPLAKNLTNEDKQILAKSIGRNYKDINQFDWYEAIWSDVGQEEVYYYLKTGNNLEQDVQKEKVNSKLYNEWQNFIKENKDFVDSFYKLPKETQKELKKDFDKLKEKNDWYIFELSNLEYDIRKNLLKQEGYLENKINITSLYAKQISEQSNKIEGINISSRATDKLGKRLTNPNWYAKDLMDVEAPYKANASKIKAPHLNAEEALKYDMNLMYKLQVQKFQKNPELIDEINERGGLEFIKQSSHIVGVKNSRWEGKGMDSNFIKVLSKSYTTVAKELNKFKEGIAGSSTALYAEQISEQNKNSTIEFQEEQSSGYIERTRKNASADATIDFGLNQTGESWTKKAVDNNKKKYIGINTNNLTITPEMVNSIVESLNSVNAKTLNIAGMGIYNMKNNTQEQIDVFVYNLLKQVIKSPNLKTNIESIRTGGQTGFDEAGAKASQKLGIKTIVLAPKGWVFRNKEGRDISNKQAFENRFNQSNIVNSGNYSSNDVIFVSIGGKRGNEIVRKQQQDRTIKEAIKAIEAGATLITDNVNYIHYNSITKQQRPITMSIEEFRKENGLYNEGEKRLYENLKSKGYNYSEQTIDGQLLGVWKKENSIKNTNTLSYSDLYQRYFDRALQVAPNNLLSLSKNDYLADFLYGKLKIQKPSNTNLTNDTKSNC